MNHRILYERELRKQIEEVERRLEWANTIYALGSGLIADYEAHLERLLRRLEELEAATPCELPRQSWRHREDYLEISDD